MGSAERTTIKLFIVDTFSDKPFHGSPCPVCVLPYDVVLDDQTMENIAVELSMSEAAFLCPLAPADDFATSGRFGLRWFKPGREVKLCGHGTVATAAVLFQKYKNRCQKLILDTPFSGLLTVQQEGGRIAVDFPLGFTVPKNLDSYASVAKCFPSSPAVCDVVLCPRLRYLLLRVTDGLSRREFETLSFDLGGLEQAVAATDVIVFIVTSRGPRDQGYLDEHGQQYDFVSRVFVPFCVRPEDPVTGSAQTVLAHYWSQELRKNHLYARQCSPRGGEVRMTVEGDRVHVLADATVVMEGQLTF